jgi:peptide deformylase
MAKLKIYTFPDLVLKQKAEPIVRVEKSMYKLADDMLETMYDAPGIGLAANQVGILQRILVIDTDYDVDDEHPDGTKILVERNPIIIINPEIFYREGEIVYPEGCLSCPEYRADVKRANKIKVKFKNIDGLEKVLDVEGVQAVCIQHEIDHLDGKLFIERLSPLKKEMAKKKLIRERKDREQDDQ